MNGKDSCNRKPEAATISDILYLFCQGNLFLPGKAQRKSLGILISDACSSHYILSFNVTVPSGTCNNRDYNNKTTIGNVWRNGGNTTLQSA